MEEECGIAAAAFSENASTSLYYSLYSLQHRGQESAGIATYSNQIQITKGMGLVPEAFDREDIDRLEGNKGIGHVRYSTSGKSKIENSQPLVVRYSEGNLALAHNGHIVNSEPLREELEQDGHVFTTGNDSEIIAHLFVKYLIDTLDIFESIKKASKDLIGSYSIVMLVEDKLIAVRDPKGIKPLCIGKTENGYMVVSESIAIDTLGGELIRDVKPGEIVEIKQDELNSRKIQETNEHSHCFFEHIYFARTDSFMDNRLNYDCRLNVGKKLGEKYPVEDADLVSPVPDSGITFAIGYAEETGTRYLESLMKNRYVGRTFIMPGQDMRENAVRLKLNGVKSNVEGKKIVLVDDSIVRGITSTRIIKMLKEMGAEEIHFRVGSPPIIAPCYFGIDMATRKELIAPNKTEEQIGNEINADSLKYIKIDEMLDAMDAGRQEFCLGCLNTNYPYNIPSEE
ncbi:amidophosphoribosyltransferase [archaeon SCG-AAA382B04]|nr:amidophosphoribosyltransferase [archaeon SCG-AAA382B04]